MPYKDIDLGEAIKIYEKDEDGLILLASSQGTPATTASKFAKGAIVVDVENAKLYVNTGTPASPTWESTTTIDLADLESGIAPSHVVKYAGTFTTVGGDAAEAITVTGAAATDIVAVTVKTAGATPRSIVAAAAATNAINVTLSGDPSTDHVLQYVVFRAAA